MIIRWLTGLIKREKKREKVKTEIEELKKAILEDPKFRDDILRELEYRTGRRDLLKVGVLGLLGLGLGLGGSHAYSTSINTNTVREVVSDYAGVKIPKPCTCIVAQDGTGDFDVSPNEDASEVIQRAIDYAHSKGGGEVRIREGYYNAFRKHVIEIGDGVMLKLERSALYVKNIAVGSNTVIDGGFVSKIEFGGRKGDYLYIPNSEYSRLTNIHRKSGGDENIYLIGVEIDGRRDIGVHYNRVITFYNVKNLSIINCYIHDGNNQLFEVKGGENILIRDSKFENAGKGICGVGIHNAKNVNIDNVEIRNVRDLGLNISNGARDVWVTNSRIHDCVAGIFIEVTNKNLPVENIFINMCKTYNNAHDGIGIYSPAGYGLIRNVRIIGGQSTGNLRGIRSNGDDVLIAMVDVRGNKWASIEVTKLYGVSPGKHTIINCIE